MSNKLIQRHLRKGSIFIRRCFSRRTFNRDSCFLLRIFLPLVGFLFNNGFLFKSSFTRCPFFFKMFFNICSSLFLGLLFILLKFFFYSSVIFWIDKLLERGLAHENLFTVFATGMKSKGTSKEIAIILHRNKKKLTFSCRNVHDLKNKRSFTKKFRHHFNFKSSFSADKCPFKNL